MKKEWVQRSEEEKVGKTLQEELIYKSDLVEQLKRLYDQVNNEARVILKLNKWIDCCFSMQPLELFKKKVIRPYNAFLLYSHSKKLELPLDPSNLLAKFLKVVGPNVTFAQIHLDTGMSYDQIFELSAYAEYWGYGKIIDAIHHHSLHVSNRNLQLTKSDAPMMERFLAKFGIGLVEAINFFSKPRYIHEFERKETDRTNYDVPKIIIWLLEHDYIVQAHTYIYLVIPESVNAGKCKIHLEGQESDRDIDRKPLDPEYYGDLLQKLREKADESDSVFATFEKICPYMNGQYSIEDMIWLEMCKREDINKQKVKYAEYVVFVNRE